MRLPLQKSMLLILSTVLMGCQINANATTIATNPLLLMNPLTSLSMDDLTVRIDLESMIVLSNENNPYLLYVGNPSCSSCLQFQPILLDWVAKTKAMVYYLDTLQHFHHLSMIQEEFPTYFPEGFSTPTLFILKGEERIQRIAANQAFFDGQRFQALMFDYVSISSELT